MSWGLVGAEGRALPFPVSLSRTSTSETAPPAPRGPGPCRRQAPHGLQSRPLLCPCSSYSGPHRACKGEPGTTTLGCPRLEVGRK